MRDKVINKDCLRLTMSVSLSTESQFTQTRITTNGGLESSASSHNQSPSLSPKEFDYLSQLIHTKAGIFVPRNKIGMLEGRLVKRLRLLGLKDFSQYILFLKQDSAGKEFEFFVNALTTNKTEFFREKVHFEHLKDVLERQHKQDTVFIWSAACSSGEEVYTLAMLCEELRLDAPAFDYRILGTDIDTERLKMSATGIYEKSTMSNTPPIYQQKYMESINHSNDNSYNNFKVGAKLRRRVKFRQHNLIDFDDNLPINFNFIFLRNVLFYFAKDNAEKIVRKLVSRLQPGGLFFVSLTETLRDMDVGLTQVGPSVYQKA